MATMNTALWTTERQTEMYRFFSVAFNAAPGTTYMDQLYDAVISGMSTKEIVNAFVTKTEFTSVYPRSMANASFATKIVDNVVGSSASATAKAAAVADITAALTAGMSRGDIVYQIFTNLANKPATDADWAGTAKQMANQVEVAKYYTETLNKSGTDLATLQKVVAGVTNNTDVSSAAAIASVIDTALPPAPQTFTLSTGADTTMVGGAGADSFNAVIGTNGLTSNGTTLNPGDSLVGGAGTDSLNISISGTNTLPIITSTVSLSGIENVNVTNFQTDDAQDNTISLALATGVTKIALTASAATGDTLFAGVNSVVTAEMSSGAGDLSITYADAAVAGTTALGTAETQVLNLNGQTAGTFTAAPTSAGAIETVTIKSEGSTNTITAAVTGATTINVTGNKNLVLTEGMTNTVTKVNASGFTGNLTYTTDDSTSVAITGGSGNDGFLLGTTYTSAGDTIDGGAGDDTLTVAGAITALANVSNVETLAVTGGNAITLAAPVSPTIFTVSDAGPSVVTFNTGYTGATRVNIGATDSVVNSANVELTVAVSETNASTGAGISVTGGTGVDTLRITADSSTTAFGTANLLRVDRIYIVDGGDSASTAGSDAAVTLSGPYATNLTIDGSELDAGTSAADETLTVDGTSQTTVTTVMSVIGGGGADSFIGGSGNDILMGNGGADTLVGSQGGNDSIAGGDGDDVILMGGALTSDDTIDGGAGNDILAISSLGITTALANVSNIETISLSGNGSSLSLTSNLSVTTFDLDTVDALPQTLTLGAGFSSAATVYVDAGDTVSNAGAKVALTVFAAGAGLAGTTLTGSTAVETLSVRADDSTVTMSSITSFDSVIIRDFGDSLTSASSLAGKDITLSLASYGSGTSTSRLSIDASSLDAGTGTGLTTNAEILTITGASAQALAVIGGGSHDIIIGSSNSAIGDSLFGGGGNDTFTMAANLTYLDSVDGGDGAGDVLSVDAGRGDIDFLNVKGVEELTLTSAGTTNLGAYASATGIGTINGVATASGNETINASGVTTALVFVPSTGDDTLVGGTGADIFVFRNGELTAADSIVGGAGTDTIRIENTGGTAGAGVATSATLKAVSGVEQLTVSDLGTGTTGTVTISLDLAYAQTALTIDGSALDDGEIFTVNANLNAGTERVTIIGGAAADVLRGGAGADSISGGSGDDAIFGGAGADTLSGGSGNDVFNYNVPTDTGAISSAVLASGLPLVTGTSISTIGMDKLLDFAVGDTIVTNITGQGAAGTLSVSSNIDAIWTALEGLVKGTYDATAQTFVVGAGGSSSMYIFDGDGSGAGTTLYGIVLVGYVQSGAAGSTTGLIGTSG